MSAFLKLNGHNWQ